MSDSVPPKLDPEALVLRASPRRVVRFKRNLLIGIAAIGCVAIAGLTWMALRGSGLHFGQGGNALATTGQTPTPDSLAGLPSNYGQIAQPAPKVGPKLPGDLGPGIVQREQQLGVSPAGSNTEDEAERAKRLRLAQQAEQAREAGVFLQLTQRNSGAAAVPTAATPPATATTQESPAGADAAHLNLDLVQDQNDQQRKLDFVNQAAARDIYNDHALQIPASPYEALAGTVIAASLLTGLNSTCPARSRPR